jgi:hypothetical protein
MSKILISYRREDSTDVAGASMTGSSSSLVEKGCSRTWGGSWEDRPERMELNVWVRRSDKSDDRADTIGFRLAQDIP